ncbi:intermembrane phospholipid transport protein YdbH family protein [Sphingomonas sp. DT-204]|uniref:YdbH domain-containing protein n=1 Tax=Sphingomonas sp. DT-204 TaxID=3396166 RepID=UPI003F1BF671
MSEDEEAATGTKRRLRWRRRLRGFGVVLAVVAVAAALAWWQRRGIAEDLVTRELAKRGVPARYRVADVGFGMQRLTDIVIGDPRDPDLTADWVEVFTRVGLGGPEVTGIAVGHAFLKARLLGGSVSLGAIDRLLPPPSGKPFALPRLGARIDDLRVRLTTDYGQVGFKIAGRGRLDDGFDGRVAAFAYALGGGGCRAVRPHMAAAVRIRGGKPTLTGPVAADALACNGMPKVMAPGADVAVTLGERLDRWQGEAKAIGAATVGAPGQGVEQLRGTVRFAGDARRTAGTLDIGSGGFAVPGIAGREARASGRYELGGAGLRFAGTLRAAGAAADRRILGVIAGYRDAGAGTPIGPLVARLASALGAAGRNFDVVAQVRVRGREVAVERLGATSASGAQATLSGNALRFGTISLGGSLAVRGGGLPTLDAALRQEGGALAGRVVAAPYEALGARLALAPVTFRAGSAGVTEVATVATLSGPLGDGRVDGLRLPIEVRWRGSALALNPHCVPLSWERFAVAGLALDPARLTLCPRGPALLTVAGGRIGGATRIAAPRLAGRIGGTPLTLAAAGADLAFGERDFVLADVAARLGTPERLTRIDAARLTGRLEGTDVAGRFEGASGQIGNVPLLLSDGAGTWRLAGGRLTLGGGLQVADAAPQPRFKPLRSDDVALTLVDGRIEAAGSLYTPKDGSKVADVTLGHDLSGGTGQAALVVPGIAFAEKGLQPDDLTALTFGVIAAVNGRVSGRGDIAWSGEGVTSSGRFATDGTDLAAAFGPVTGLKGEVAFRDLLGMVTPPGQVATIATVNPGVAVENGTVRYHLLGPAKVAIEGGRWPFAGGELVLEPTVLDFSARQVRRMTFRVTGIDAGQFLQQFEFKNLNATGVFDGVLPMVFDESGGRIENGHLAARTGGNLAYVGEVSQKDLGTWGNLAFQALKSLDYRNLELTMNGPLAGEMITEIRFAGLGQGKGTKSNFLIRRLARLPLVFNVTVRAPFRQLVDSVRSYYDPSLLIQRNLPALLEEQRRRQGQQQVPPPIQPSESGKAP